MISPELLFNQIQTCNFTHVIWIPDSETGRMQPLFDSNDSPKLIRACREGEAFGIAAGLKIGGANPLIIIQCTGMFEAGDALRNIIFDLDMPLFMIVGYRSYEAWQKDPETRDTARRFAEPILNAWGLKYTLVEADEQATEIGEAYKRYTESGQTEVILLGEA
jgi:sulfopyruvate decarboxylase TPP-binding subunit